MLEKTKQLKAEIASLGNNYESKIEKLYKQYHKQKCYLLCCGPSISRYDYTKLKNKLKNELVICIKNTYKHFKDICDFHFFNCCNLPKPNPMYHYEYNNHTIAVASSNFPEKTRWSPLQKYDIFFKIPTYSANTNTNEILSLNKKFEENLLENKFERCLGPGIMYETIIYTILHLGVSEINVFGWDIAPNNSHYYGDNSVLWNPGNVISWERQSIIDSSEHLNNWLLSKNIELNIYSNSSCLCDKINRKEMAECLA